MVRTRTERASRVRAWAVRSFVLLAVVGADVATTACGKLGESPIERAAHAEGGAPAPKVTVATPVVKSIHAWRDYTGRAQAVDSVEIRARVGGYLDKAAFREGDQVKKGDLLFVVDPRPFAASHARAEAELEGARAEAALAKIEAVRSDKLWAEHVIADREHDLEKSQLLQRDAQAKRAEAVLNETALDLDYSRIRAPIDGRIGRIQITPGNLVGPSTVEPLTTLVSIDPLHVYVDVVEADAMRLNGSESAAEVGFPGEDGYPHAAAIDFIDNHVDPATGTVKVRAVVKNPDGKLTPGLFARLRLAPRESQDAVLVVDSAFGTDQSHKFAYVVDDAGTVAYRDVELGEMFEGLRIVKKGLASTDRVVVHGLQRIRPGVHVDAEVTSAMPNGAGSAAPAASEKVGEAR